MTNNKSNFKETSKALRIASRLLRNKDISYRCSDRDEMSKIFVKTYKACIHAVYPGDVDMKGYKITVKDSGSVQFYIEGK